jgi:hypothetical protein
VIGQRSFSLANKQKKKTNGLRQRQRQPIQSMWSQKNANAKTSSDATVTGWLIDVAALTVLLSLVVAPEAVVRPTSDDDDDSDETTLFEVESDDRAVL